MHDFRVNVDDISKKQLIATLEVVVDARASLKPENHIEIASGSNIDYVKINENGLIEGTEMSIDVIASVELVNYL